MSNVENKVNSYDGFCQTYWSYYLMLEKEFLETEKYLTIHESNFQAFSNEFIKQYQVICSEVDVVAKAYCKELNPDFNGNRINDYSKIILDSNDDFTYRTILLPGRSVKVKPWEGWSYEEKINIKGKECVVSSELFWWKSYNDVKHKRSTITEKRYNYESANLKNVLNALAALFQLEMYFFRTLHERYFPDEPDMPSESTLFKIENWGNKYIVRDIFVISFE